MNKIVLEECWDMRPDPNDTEKLVNTYLGMIVANIEDLTPEFLAKLKADKDDKHGWKKYRKLMKDKGYDIG